MENKAINPMLYWGKYIGKKYNKLLILKICGKNKFGHALCECLCDCGNKTIAEASSVLSGNTKSCGCLKIYNIKNRNRTHGMSNTRLYRVWKGMRNRCYNKNSNSYVRYGGRGITVCDEWRNDFVNFYNWAIENGYDESADRGEFTIDRINNNGDYCPENCRLGNYFIQANNKRSNRLITYNNECKNVKEWSKYFGFDYKYFHQKLKENDWSVEKVLGLPYFKEKIK